MGSPNILIVEDEYIIAKGIQKRLEKMGYIVSAPIASGEEAVVKVEKEDPDLVLMDIMLKGEMDGIEAADLIRSRFGIPVIFLTAYADDERLQQAKRTQPYGYVLKPFRGRELKIVIEMALYAAKIDAERKQSEEKVLRAKQEWERTFDAVPDLIAILDHNHRIVRINKAMAERLDLTPEKAIGLTCYEHIHGTKEPLPFCPFKEMLTDGREHTAEIHVDILGGNFLVSTSPLHDTKGRLAGCVHVARDITELKMTEAELRDALDKVRTLSGFLPICSSCKKIRDDKGYWNQIEAYISKHSEAEFSHSICPECIHKLYPDFY